MTINVVSQGEDLRLGTVQTTNTETFELPPMVNDLDLRIQVDPIGTPANWVSQNIVYAPGDVIDVRGRSTLDLSPVTLR